jgi:hypothetical protein
MYFFDEGLDPNSELNDTDIYTKFERASLFYISQNIEAIVFVNNIFEHNIGLYGGAINIDNPDWTGHKPYQLRNTPYVIVENNSFKQNMAYIAGNAVYIRLV